MRVAPLLTGAAVAVLAQCAVISIAAAQSAPAPLPEAPPTTTVTPQDAQTPPLPQTVRKPILPIQQRKSGCERQAIS